MIRGNETMDSKVHFIKATEELNTFEQNVPAYYFRKSYVSDTECSARIKIAVCGFYELYFNGRRITRGFLSPYVSNTNHYVYCDEYNVTLDGGENVIGVLLGNGLQNNPGGYIWDFDTADFRSAPSFALEMTSGADTLLTTDESFKTAPSPIRSDDYRFGEYYDARFEMQGWCDKGFPDSAWKNALPATTPRGELRIADTDPIVKECEIAPVEITKCADGYIYDFGISNAGVCRLKIRGERGQKIILRHADSLIDGDLNLAQIWFERDFWERDREIIHRDTYICRGDAEEIYEPTFTYHGFRYVKVTGINDEQATPELLTYLVYHTDLKTRGDFECSDTMTNTLQTITRRSILSNFHHFPTDCPQREKNGWTADAALSCEAALMNFSPERNYREWMRNICKAQSENGALPGIIPTDNWGYAWGNGPAWDCVLTLIPYYTYLYRGSTEMIKESAESLVRYLNYLRSRCDELGLLHFGLGDWCHVGVINSPKSPLIVTDSIMAMNIAEKTAVMLEKIEKREDAEFARAEAEKYKAAIRANLLDLDSMTIKGECQTSQALGLYYNVFENGERERAFAKLLDMVHEADDHIDVGVLGGRVIFHVLTEFGYADLAFKMITREDYPSYGNWVKRGATTLWENFNPTSVLSMNHHFWGDISTWFIKAIAGIRPNPNGNDVSELEIAPNFIGALDHASAYHIAPSGKISSAWRREGERIILELKIPEAMHAVAKLPLGYLFENGESCTTVTSGRYEIIKNI